MKMLLRPRRDALAILTAILVLVSVAPRCVAQQSGAKSDKSVYLAIENVPAKAQSKRNLLQNDPDAAAAGQKLFEEHCAECHGGALEGGRRGPKLRTPGVERATPGALFWILSNGIVRHGMPDWSKLPERERWQIVTFLKAMQSEERHP